ncbi:zinc-dependent protease, membrane associated (putative) [Lactobacillus plantarum JDM1] [Lactiplantibacillus mudanjiangensis]|uniref:Zinc metalloprotease n=1 Tax=Lactiplantibacillus mudanjiangensis TaxID=1296538 RepID=A0A660E6G5_9LACO|nr:zinc-dependent protease, membrane associated (putative) [Lactobacillus plantarum JDM1] [Lactiplantibacillus mudanjiangensis]VDG28623.1 zinc-dependent protease, membrane associated (putative) [Lactobacillus plantarum JDM1] [Lactiplantibacillus mudanjiangensis]VDG30678.1 zinc-dependent protease, membrane associated (putative) [Lactobacillus plantarum JDM1] [Lactiplantibacillus mudanjiangensis]
MEERTHFLIVTIITFIIVFGILVIVHEFGHFYFAKRAGILVREFSVGMGPKAVAFRRNATTYTLRLLPIGGYVRMAGVADDEDDELKPGTPISLQVGQDGLVHSINASKKTTLFNGIPLSVTASDLEKELWIEGYENGDESEVKRYPVDHDATIIESDGTEVQIAPVDVQFQSAKLWQRMLTNFAGPMNNFILAIITFAILAFMQGGVTTVTTKVAATTANSVARQAGIKAGDQIVSVNGKKMTSAQSISVLIQDSPNKTVKLGVKRAGQTRTVSVKPKAKTVSGNRVGQIGVQWGSHTDSRLSTKLTYGFTGAWSITTQIFQVLGRMVTHGFSLNDLGGPVAIFATTSQAAKSGIRQVIYLLAVLSINLGIVNLLPIPALDGGKLLLNIIEGIRGKPLRVETESVITLIGFGLLMLLMVLVTWNDIQRYFF